MQLPRDDLLVGLVAQFIPALLLCGPLWASRGPGRLVVSMNDVRDLRIAPGKPIRVALPPDRLRVFRGDRQ